MNHFYLKIQTMGLSADSAIVSIALIKMDLTTDRTVPIYYEELDWRDQGRAIDRETVKFWKTQNEASKSALAGLSDLPATLTLLSSKIPANAKIWAYIGAFTFGLLDHAFTQCKITKPWKPWDQLDVQTINWFEDAKRGQLISTFLERDRTLAGAIKESEKLCKIISNYLK